MIFRSMGIAAGILLVAASASTASVPQGVDLDGLSAPRSTAAVAATAGKPDGAVEIARRGRGADDPPGDDHGRHRGDKHRGGHGDKHHGGHDDGPNHT